MEKEFVTVRDVDEKLDRFRIEQRLLVLGGYLALQLDIPAEISAPAGVAFIARCLWTLRR